jgi:hypothetical protein
MMLALLGFREWGARTSELVFVPVPKTDIPPGTQLSALSHMDAVEMPLRLVSAGMVQSADDVNGKYALTTLYAGIPFSKKAIGTRPPDSSVYELPPGHVAFPLTVDRRSLLASSSFIRRGSLIDLVVVTATSDKDNPTWILAIPPHPPAEPLISKVRVLDVINKNNTLVWVLDLTSTQAVSMAAIDAQAYNVYAILTDPQNEDLRTVLGKGGEDK